MDRRSFVVRALAAVPVLPALVGARRFKDVTLVSVTYDGEKPAELRIVGDILRSGAGLVTYDASRPLTLSTPADFYVNVEKRPAIIEAKGNQSIKVVADRQMSAQHLMARARRVTIRRIAPVPPANAVSRIELVGEARATG